MSSPLPSQTNGHSPPGKTGRAGRIDIASIRREQIVEASIGIIVQQGLHQLSLSKIEKAAGMKRGQLTYYFPTKEDILLAVFDRLVQMLHQRMEGSAGPCDDNGGFSSAWDLSLKLLHMALRPPAKDDFGQQFHALQHTFLAETSHREDFRQRLASLYEKWRDGAATLWEHSAHDASPLAKSVSPRTLGSFLQSIIHGLFVQLSADPEAFDRTEMLKLCIGVLAPLFGGDVSSPTQPRRAGQSRRPKEDSHE
jgi:AcrR family transcriptional regulator